MNQLVAARLTFKGKNMWEIQKTLKGGPYLYAKVQNHPKANKNGLVLHHRVVMENAIGRVLLTTEVVHHKNGNTHDNRIENLELMTHSSHSKHHNPKCAVWAKLRCPICGKIFHRARHKTHLSKKHADSTCCSRHCGSIKSRMYATNTISQETIKAVLDNVIEEYIKGT